MKSIAATVLFLTLASGGVSAAAQDAERAASPQTPEDVQDATTRAGQEEPRLICTREKPIGSNRAVRVCRTQEQIDAQNRAAQESMRRSRGGPNTRT